MAVRSRQFVKALDQLAHLKSIDWLLELFILHDHFFNLDEVVDALDKKIVTSFCPQDGLLKLQLLFLPFNDGFETKDLFGLGFRMHYLVF